MLGYNEETDEVFCDLQCRFCGGLQIQSCPMTGNIGNMRMAQSRCMGLGLNFLNFYTPTGFWSRAFCLDRKTLPTVPDFPQYKLERVS